MFCFLVLGKKIADWRLGYRKSKAGKEITELTLLRPPTYDHSKKLLFLCALSRAWNGEKKKKNKGNSCHGLLAIPLLHCALILHPRSSCNAIKNHLLLPILLFYYIFTNKKTTLPFWGFFLHGNNARIEEENLRIVFSSSSSCCVVA